MKKLITLIALGTIGIVTNSFAQSIDHRGQDLSALKERQRQEAAQKKQQAIRDARALNFKIVASLEEIQQNIYKANGTIKYIIDDKAKYCPIKDVQLTDNSKKGVIICTTDELSITLRLDDTVFVADVIDVPNNVSYTTVKEEPISVQLIPSPKRDPKDAGRHK